MQKRLIFLKYVFLSAALLTSGCVSARLRMLENSGTIRTDFTKDHDYDYVVFMEGITHLGWDGNSKDDRHDTLIRMFGDRCKQLKIGDEVSAQIGSEKNGKPVSTWVMKVKCVNP
ncbi:MAG: hypothetical protein JNL11_11860 [Bdellovibrionaceae bacterium]|nr:hypothetical protein [Pseudobdellovibrionaceae bacterium]